MGKKFVPIRFGLIEEGRLAASLDEELARAAKALVAHVQKWGPDVTKKSRATVTLKVDFAPQSAEDGSYSITASVASRLPGRPVHATLAIHEAEQTGEETLFVRASGSDGTTPRQMKFATDDGLAVDPKTGEVIDHKKETN